MKSPHVVLFVDVDQSFFEAVTGSDCRDVRRLLRSGAVSLVLCSNMTRPELEMCQQALEIRDPFVCESGSAVVVPHGYFSFDVAFDRRLAGYGVIEFGTPYLKVVELLHRTARRAHVDVVGFSQLSVDEVAADCGVSLSQARLAKLRDYDEPIRPVDGSARRRFLRALYSARLACVYRGAHDHVGAAVDKGRCVGLLTAIYRRAFGAVVTIGAGEATNSAALLGRVTSPFVLESTPEVAHARLLPKIPRLSLAHGPNGWLVAIATLAERALQRPASSHHLPAAG